MDLHWLEKRFEKRINGKEIGTYFLDNKNGIKIALTNYGARIIALLTPDALGNLDDVVLGFDNIDNYLSSDEKFYGATVGRFCSRIANGKFILNGKTFQLDCNHGNNHLHGGSYGLTRRIWDAEQKDENTISFKYFSQDGEDLYPGNMLIEVQYKILPGGELIIEYKAETDIEGLCNLTHHSYFNLKGTGNGPVTDHLFQLNADKYTPVNAQLIPTGSILNVDGTIFDFSKPVKLSERMDLAIKHLAYSNGFDHNFVINRENKKEVVWAASVFEPQKGRKLEVFTDQLGVQFYTGNLLSGNDTGKYGHVYKPYWGFCLETQGYPDSPNHTNFPSAVLFPGEKYNHVCIYKFGTIT